jgi:hypothetical protein
MATRRARDEMNVGASSSSIVECHQNDSDAGEEEGNWGERERKRENHGWVVRKGTVGFFI